MNMAKWSLMRRERANECAEGLWQCDLPLDGKALSIQTSGPANGETAITGFPLKLASWVAGGVKDLVWDLGAAERRVMLSAGAEWVAVPTSWDGDGTSSSQWRRG